MANVLMCCFSGKAQANNFPNAPKKFVGCDHIQLSREENVWLKNALNQKRGLIESDQVR